MRAIEREIIHNHELSKIRIQRLKDELNKINDVITLDNNIFHEELIILSDKVMGKLTEITLVTEKYESKICDHFKYALNPEPDVGLPEMINDEKKKEYYDSLEGYEYYKLLIMTTKILSTINSILISKHDRELPSRSINNGQSIWSSAKTINCLQNCDECASQHDVYTYCEKCPICIVRRREAKKSKMIEERARIRLTRKSIPKPQIKPEDRPGKILYDRYYWIELNAAREDGDDDHIKYELFKVFKLMQPPSSNFKMSAHILSFDSNQVPCLFGLIRYGLDGEVRLSRSSALFKREIRKQHSKEKNIRPRVINRLTTHIDKCYETNITDIQEKYNFLTSHGTIIGSDLMSFLMVDVIQ